MPPLCPRRLVVRLPDRVQGVSEGLLPGTLELLGLPVELLALVAGHLAGDLFDPSILLTVPLACWSSMSEILPEVRGAGVLRRNRRRQPLGVSAGGMGVS